MPPSSTDPPSSLISQARLAIDLGALHAGDSGGPLASTWGALLAPMALKTKPLRWKASERSSSNRKF